MASPLRCLRHTLGVHRLAHCEFMDLREPLQLLLPLRVVKGI